MYGDAILTCDVDHGGPRVEVRVPIVRPTRDGPIRNRNIGTRSAVQGAYAP